MLLKRYCTHLIRKKFDQDIFMASMLNRLIELEANLVVKEIRRKNLEKNFLEIQMKGQDHYVFIKDNGKAQVIYDQGRWVTEHIRTAVLKFNYEIDKIDKLLVKDFTDEELNEYEKTLQ